MKCIICDNLWQEKWDDFVKNNSLDFGLLQSWGWGEFQEKIGKKIFRLAVIDDNENVMAVAGVIKNSLRLGKSYFYVPRGPILQRSITFSAVSAPSPVIPASSSVIPAKAGILNLEPKIPTAVYLESKIPVFTGMTLMDGFDLLMATLKDLGKKEGAIFLRIEPAWGEDENSRKFLTENRFQFIGQVQPRQTLVLDLQKSETDLLSDMKSKTRYNIKVAQKHKITADEGAKYFDDFWRLMEKTSQRDQFISHNKQYYKKMLDECGQGGVLKLVVAKLDDKVIAGNIMAFFGSWAVYLHGASDYDFRNYMAPYLLQWHSIVEAKGAGFLKYDFWGVDEKKWPGVTRFKRGFNEDKKFDEYVGAWDEIYSKFWYNLYRIIRR